MGGPLGPHAIFLGGLLGLMFCTLSIGFLDAIPTSLTDGPQPWHGGGLVGRRLPFRSRFGANRGSSDMALSWQTRGAKPPQPSWQLRTGGASKRPARQQAPAASAAAPPPPDWQQRGGSSGSSSASRSCQQRVSNWQQCRGGGGDGELLAAGAEQAGKPPVDWQRRGATTDAPAGSASGDSGGGAGAGRRLNLDMAALCLAAGEPGRSCGERPSAAAQNGASRSRIQALLKNGCCNCANNCAGFFSANIICQICTEFWSLPSKEVQDYLLMTMFRNLHPSDEGATVAVEGGPIHWQRRGAKRSRGDDDGGEAIDDDFWDAEILRPPEALEAAAKGRTQWALGDQDVCLEAFHRLLGIGKHRLLKVIAGALDMRRTFPGMLKKPSGREAAQSNLCDRFFAELYMSSAEPEPNEFRDCSKDTDGGANENRDLSRPLDIAFCERDMASMLPHFIQNPLVQGYGGPRPPVRMLQYSRLHDLYWLFLATVALWLEPLARRPSWMTFWRAWNRKWKGFLRFRGTEEHSKCTFCWKCRKVLATHISLQDKYTVAERLRVHLANQYADRCIYWALRHESRLKGNVLVIIIDSMDKSKLPIPRWKFGEKPKVLEGFVRPVMTLTASLAHGWGANF